MREQLYRIVLVEYQTPIPNGNNGPSFGGRKFNRVYPYIRHKRAVTTVFPFNISKGHFQSNENCIVLFAASTNIEALAQYCQVE